MRIKSFLAAGLLATAAVAGVSTAASASAAPVYQEVAYGGTYVGTYATLNACRADGESPSTGGYYWECIESWDGWDLYIYY
ncbi:hypothetical protein [Nocardia arthritidis]|jgi:hypothetical protein|uniref:hypothetical protein n=1 Tax=Nocardia arthritidis TaxID=228602 RepID=UPI0007A4D8A7|nr:hypothetical protein [Nocardia arthritidis]